MSIETEDIYEETEVAAVQPATASQGSTYTATLAPVGSSIPSTQSSSVGQHHRQLRQRVRHRDPRPGRGHLRARLGQL